MNLTFPSEKIDPNNAHLENNQSAFNNSAFNGYFNVIAAGASMLLNINREGNNITGGEAPSQQNKNNSQQNIDNSTTNGGKMSSEGSVSVNVMRKFKVYRVCLLSVYVLTVWALNRLKRTALMEGELLLSPAIKSTIPACSAILIECSNSNPNPDTITIPILSLTLSLS